MRQPRSRALGSAVSRATARQAVLRVDPGGFAMVMATGIVSAALSQDGLPGPADVLLGIAVAGFVSVAVVLCLRAAWFPADARAGLTPPERGFPAFCLVAACAVVGNGLAADGQSVTAAVLAIGTVAGWLTITCLVPVRLAVGGSARQAVMRADGTWYLFAVATQSVAIACVITGTDGLLPRRAAAAAAITAWSAGLLVYLATSAIVSARLLRAGPGPAQERTPYWVTMGAASIGVLAAARILRVTGPSAGRSAIAGLAVALWVIATCLIPVVAALQGRPPLRPRYLATRWMIVFPLGMYATAGESLGAAAGEPLISHVAEVAVWPAAAAWLLVFTAMASAPFTRAPSECQL
jgi:tellurite resistance protein TehA-like permease